MNITPTSAEQNAARRPPKADATVSIFLPEFEHFPKISAFYKKAALRCRRFSSRLPSLFPECDLLYCVRADHGQSSDRVTVKIRASLSDRKTMRLLSASEQTHVWSARHQLLIKISRRQLK